MSYLSYIQSVTCRILDTEKTVPGELYSACDELYGALIKITGINTTEDINRETHLLNCGEAIGLSWAAMCIKDYNRTKRFMDGITEATCHALEINAGRPVHILYAGTGPLATLMLPVISRFSEQQVQFTLLEVNEPSFNCLQKMISILNLERYIHHIEKADATTWTLPLNDPVDIFIAETMQQGLVKEPQVALYMNIIPQLPSHTIIIPEQVTLTAALVNLGERMKRKQGIIGAGNAIHVLGTVFELNRKTIRAQASNQQPGETLPAFNEITIRIPAEAVATHPLLYLLTDIIVYNKQTLSIDQSQLTLPLKLTELYGPLPYNIKFTYHTGKNPGIHFNSY